MKLRRTMTHKKKTQQSKKVFRMKAIAAVLATTLSATTHASVSSNLNNFFDNLGYSANVTMPRSYQDQAAGFYSGGSIYIRNQVSDYQLVNISLPSFGGGCSGIDAFLGSFTMITGAQIQKMIHQIISSAGAYTVDLALETTMPQIKVIKDYLQKFMSDVNNMNINTCSTAEGLVGGLWPKTQASQQQICRDVQNSNGIVTDWAKARQDCNDDMNEKIDAKDTDQNQKIVNKNLVWDALGQYGNLTSDDSELAEFIMSISGSYIVESKGKDEETKSTPLASLANSQGLIKALLEGGQAQIYICDELDKCLNPTITKITISEKDSLQSKVSNYIEQLNLMLANDTPITDALKDFLEACPIPVMKAAQTSLELNKTLNPAEYSHIIALSLLEQYLNQAITTVKTAMLREDTPYNDKMDKQIKAAQQDIAQRMANEYRKIANTTIFTTQLMNDEKQVVSKIGEMVNQ